MSELGEEEEKKEKKKPEQRGTTTGEEELGTGLSNRTRGAPEQRGEEEKESRRGEWGEKLRSQLPPFGTPAF